MKKLIRFLKRIFTIWVTIGPNGDYKTIDDAVAAGEKHIKIL